MYVLGNFTGRQGFRITCSLPATAERLWEHLTRPDLVRLWLSQEGAEIEQKTGGRVHLRFEGAEIPERARAGAIIDGIVSAWDAPRRLTYGWTDPRGTDSEVGFSLTPLGDATLLTLTHERMPEALLPSAAAAWHTHIDLLAACLRGEKPGAFFPIFKGYQPAYKALFAGQP